MPQHFYVQSKIIFECHRTFVCNSDLFLNAAELLCAIYQPNLRKQRLATLTIKVERGFYLVFGCRLVDFYFADICQKGKIDAIGGVFLIVLHQLKQKRIIVAGKA